MATLTAQVQEQITRRVRSNEHNSPKSANKSIGVLDYFPEISEKGFTKHLSISKNVSFIDKSSAITKTSCKLKDNIARASKHKEAISPYNTLKEPKGTKQQTSFPNIPKLDPKIVETWLDTVLKEAETTAPRQYWDESKSSLERFGIGREKLTVACGNV